MAELKPMDEAPDDGTIIEAWHLLDEVWVAVGHSPVDADLWCPALECAEKIHVSELACWRPRSDPPDWPGVWERFNG